MAVVNDSGWQRRSDDWVKMLYQSRLRKERRLKDLAKQLKSNSEKGLRLDGTSLVPIINWSKDYE